MKVTKAMVVRREVNNFVRVAVTSEVTGGRSVGPVTVMTDAPWSDVEALILTEREENLARAILEGRTEEAIDPAGKR